jgi:two-component system, NarL family, nitrate/nitrite response regulator NarL
MNTPLRIALADDHGLFRQGLKALLELQPGVTLVAETERADDIAPMLDRVPCDILLLDLRMDRNVLVDVPTFAARVAVIVVTATDDPDELLTAVRAGARAVIFKRFAIEQLRDAIRAVAEGNVWLPPSLQAHIAAGLQQPSAEPLTTREREIVHHVALGLRNAEVAQRLFISQLTVKTHLNNIFQKLGIRDRVELAMYAARVGIVGVHEQSQ